MSDEELDAYASALADRIFEGLTGLPSTEWERSAPK